MSRMLALCVLLIPTVALGQIQWNASGAYQDPARPTTVQLSVSSPTINEPVGAFAVTWNISTNSNMSNPVVQSGNMFGPPYSSAFSVNVAGPATYYAIVNIW